jgi:hypothetical protein
MKKVRAWPMFIMTVFAAIIVCAAIIALGTRKPRLKTPPEAVAGEVAIPATPTGAALVDSIKKDSARKRH